VSYLATAATSRATNPIRSGVSVEKHTESARSCPYDLLDKCIGDNALIEKSVGNQLAASICPRWRRIVHVDHRGFLICLAALGDLSSEVILAMLRITSSLLVRTTYGAATGLCSICG
jgi:hypothetical protein